MIIKLQINVKEYIGLILICSLNIFIDINWFICG
mgnify:CR=1 FL=1